MNEIPEKELIGNCFKRVKQLWLLVSRDLKTPMMETMAAG